MNKRKPTRYERALAAAMLEGSTAELARSLVDGRTFKDAARAFVSSFADAIVGQVVRSTITAAIRKRIGQGRRRRRGELLRGQAREAAAMTKARMRKAREAFRLRHPLVHVAATIADAGDGSHYDQIVAALFAATNAAEKRHREFLAELRRELSLGWPGDVGQPVLWALGVLDRLERKRRVAPE